MALSWWPQLQHGDRQLTLAAAFLPHAVLLWPLAGGLLLLSTRRRAKLVSLLALLGLLGHLGVLAPYLPRGRPETPVGTPTLSVLAFNLRFGKADPDQLAALIRQRQPDLVVLSEVNDAVASQPRLREALAGYPNHLGHPAPAWAPGRVEDPTGTMLFSRSPLQATETLPSVNQQYLAVADTPVGRVDLVVVHTSNPRYAYDQWLTDHSTIVDRAAQRTNRATILVGDFNATLEHLPLRTLRTLGYADAASATGAGWQPTWPTDQPFGPLIAIDHLFTSAALRPVSISTVPIARSDHLALLVVVARG